MRIESKAVGRGTDHKVSTEEVVRFQKDLDGTNSHGIMVSLYGGITGKGTFDFDQLPNGNLAMYLSNNGYDMGALQGVLNMLYKLDERLRSDADNSNGFKRVPHETMRQVQQLLRGFEMQATRIKTQLKNCIADLNEMRFSQAVDLLLGQCLPMPATATATAPAPEATPPPLESSAPSTPSASSTRSASASASSSRSAYASSPPTPSPPPASPAACRYCSKTFLRPGCLASHEQKHLQRGDPLRHTLTRA